MKKKDRFNVHHRKPQSMGGSDEARNLSRVPISKHVAYHQLFANESPYVVAHILNKYWIDPDYILICVRKKPKQINEENERPARK